MEFNEVVKQIEESEDNVDKVLKAGRLERHERQPMSKEMLAMVLNYIVGTLAMILGFGVVYFWLWMVAH